MALGGQTTLQILAPLRDQLSEAGYEIIFECAANDCGGVDFRYALDLLPEPDMHVDLGDYRFVAAQRATDTRPEYITVVVSRTDAHGFVHPESWLDEYRRIFKLMENAVKNRSQ